MTIPEMYQVFAHLAPGHSRRQWEFINHLGGSGYAIKLMAAVANQSGEGGFEAVDKEWITNYQGGTSLRNTRLEPQSLGLWTTLSIVVSIVINKLPQSDRKSLVLLSLLPDGIAGSHLDLIFGQGALEILSQFLLVCRTTEGRIVLTIPAAEYIRARYLATADSLETAIAKFSPVQEAIKSSPPALGLRIRESGNLVSLLSHIMTVQKNKVFLPVILFSLDVV